jgi:hypothetical protein
MAPVRNGSSRGALLQPMKAILRRVVRALPTPAQRALAPLARERPRWGNLRRLAPFSTNYGYDRGTPIDRYFLRDFLAARAADVRGDVLEVKEPLYTERYGGGRVAQSHVLDVDPDNPLATIVADLSVPGSLPRGRFDCFILTQTLQLVPDLEQALVNAFQALRPGGTLLISVPTLARLDPSYPGADRWRLTPAGLEQLLSRSCAGADSTVVGYGNIVCAIAFLHGLAAEDLTRAELEHRDELSVTLVCARVVAPQ